MIILAAIMLIVVSATGAAVTFAVQTPVGEQLVEGHTVFSVIQPIGHNTTSVRFAAAVAVLVREFNTSASYTRFPGVLWFNDQYLVNPSKGGAPSTQPVYPCGAVLAVRSGDPDPRNATFDNTTYTGSYLITDPNGHAWNIDRWNYTGELIWTVALAGNDAKYNDTNSVGCTAFSDSASGKYGSSSSSRLSYNALLYFDLADLNISGTKNHADPTSPDATDTYGCQVNTFNYQTNAAEFPCPSNDDNKEGNSHPYNSASNWTPTSTAMPKTGRGNHGGSADCTGDGQPDFACHATALIDIYYGAAQKPFDRSTNYFLMDTDGTTAPYYCEPYFKTCNSVEWNDQNLQDGGSSGLPIVN